MKALKMNKLLVELSRYRFYSWEEDEEEIENFNIIRIGMSKEYLEANNLKNFYDSWGYESVNNLYAEPNFTVEQWLEIEEMFFKWFKGLRNIIFPTKEIIVTPFLEREWELADNEFEKDNFWIKGQYDKYINLLQNSRIIPSGLSIRENYRGGLIEEIKEIETLGKLAVKKLPLLFFCNQDRVISFTEYLSIIIQFKDKESHREFELKLNEDLQFQILE